MTLELPSEDVRNALPLALARSAKILRIGAWVIPTFCRSCLGRVWVWMGLRTLQLCGLCRARGSAGQHVFVTVFEDDDRNWDDVCVRCGEHRNWTAEEPTLCRPGSATS